MFVNMTGCMTDTGHTFLSQCSWLFTISLCLVWHLCLVLQYLDRMRQKIRLKEIFGAPASDWLPVLRAWPAQAASSELCSAHFSTSPKEDTGLIGKLWLSCPLHPFLSDKQLPFPASQPFCLPHLGWTCEQHPVESSCLLWVSSPNRCSL